MAVEFGPVSDEGAAYGQYSLSVRRRGGREMAVVLGCIPCNEQVFVSCVDLHARKELMLEIRQSDKRETSSIMVESLLLESCVGFVSIACDRRALELELWDFSAMTSSIQGSGEGGHSSLTTEILLPVEANLLEPLFLRVSSFEDTLLVGIGQHKKQKYILVHVSLGPPWAHSGHREAKFQIKLV